MAAAGTKVLLRFGIHPKQTQGMIRDAYQCEKCIFTGRIIVLRSATRCWKTHNLNVRQEYHSCTSTSIGHIYFVAGCTADDDRTKVGASKYVSSKNCLKSIRNPSEIHPTPSTIRPKSLQILYLNELDKIFKCHFGSKMGPRTKIRHTS